MNFDIQARSQTGFDKDCLAAKNPPHPQAFKKTKLKPEK
jgi:hypothetical protein